MIVTPLGILTDVKLVQFLKSELSIEVIKDGKAIVVSAEQPEKTELPIVLTVAGIVTDVNFEQYLKTLFPTVFKDDGCEKLTEVKFIQSSNAPSGKEVNDDGMTMDDNISHSLNAPVPKEVNVEVLTKFAAFNAMQFLKASLPIEVTLSGISIEDNFVQL